MKNKLLVAILLSLSVFQSAQSAQYNPDPRTVTRRVVPPQQRGPLGPRGQQRPQPVTPPAPAPPTDQPPAQTDTQTPAPPVTPPIRRPAPVATIRPVDPEKEKAEREKAEQRTAEFERQRAEQGTGWAQFALGMRYLSGKGVEKDPEQGRAWIEKAAKNGEEQAVKKLAELDKQKNDTPDPVLEKKPAPSEKPESPKAEKP